jgi:hypothetical protein
VAVSNFASFSTQKKTKQKTVLYKLTKDPGQGTSKKAQNVHASRVALM